MMMVEIKSDAGHVALPVDDLAEASRKVREHIEDSNLGAGCVNDGWSFHRATVNRNGRIVATISYNGRVWPAA